MTRLLVIEDEAPLLKTVLNGLRFAGYEAVGALDGAVGIEMARSYRPDLVISDIRMPELDGYGVLEALRADPETADMPLIFLTAKTEREDMRRGMALGADDYVSKPFTFDELVAAVEARLARHAPYKDMQQRLAQVSKSDQLKSDMLLLAAHGLRNPISSIRIALHMLERKYGDLHLDEDLKELNSIAAAAMRMEEITGDLLSLERIETAVFNDTVETVILNELVEDCCIACVDQARAQGLTLEWDIAPATIVVLGDPVQLQEAVRNLLTNAIKYTPEAGHVHVRLDSAGYNCVVLVEDSGYGIPASQLDRVFKPFDRARIPETLKVQGTGLGLHLVKNIVERHQGEVFVESIYGEGSVFGFFLPLYRASGPAPEPAPVLQQTNPDAVLRLISHIISL